MTPAFPLNLSDTSLILAEAAVILLITSEMISPYYGGANLKIDRKRLKNAALTMSILFLLTVAIRIGTLVSGL